MQNVGRKADGAEGYLSDRRRIEEGETHFVKAGLSVIVSLLVETRFGTPTLAGAQIGGRSIRAILAPMKLTSRPFGNSM